MDIVLANPVIAFAVAATLASHDTRYLILLPLACIGLLGTYWNGVYKNAIGDADRLLKTLERGGLAARFVRKSFPSLERPGVQIVAVDSSQRLIDQAVAMDLRDFGKVVLVPNDYCEGKPIQHFVIAHELRHVSRAQVLHDLSLYFGWVAIFSAAPVLFLWTGQLVLALLVAVASFIWHRERSISDFFSIVREIDADVFAIRAFPPADRPAMAKRIADLWDICAKSAERMTGRASKASEWRIRAKALRDEYQTTEPERPERFPAIAFYRVDRVGIAVFAILGSFASPIQGAVLWGLYIFGPALVLQAGGELMKWRWRKSALLQRGLEQMGL